MSKLTYEQYLTHTDKELNTVFMNHRPNCLRTMNVFINDSWIDRACSNCKMLYVVYYRRRFKGSEIVIVRGDPR